MWELVTVGRLEADRRGDERTAALAIVDLGREARAEHRVEHLAHRRRGRAARHIEDRRARALPPRFGIARREQDDRVWKFGGELGPERGGWPVDRGREAVEQRAP